MVESDDEKRAYDAYDEAWDMWDDYDAILNEINSLRTHIDSLPPTDPAYLERKKSAEQELAKCMVKKDRMDQQLRPKSTAGTYESTTERDQRLQRRANEMFANGMTKKEVCRAIEDEERNTSSITYARLMTILRKPTNKN